MNVACIVFYILTINFGNSICINFNCGFVLSANVINACFRRVFFFRFLVFP